MRHVIGDAYEDLNNMLQGNSIRPHLDTGLLKATQYFIVWQVGHFLSRAHTLHDTGKETKILLRQLVDIYIVYLLECLPPKSIVLKTFSEFGEIILLLEEWAEVYDDQCSHVINMRHILLKSVVISTLICLRIGIIWHWFGETLQVMEIQEHFQVRISAQLL